MKKGFTLAEVLITLGIIGVVAALTIPTLINNYQKRVLESSFARAYSTLKNGFANYMASENCTSLKCAGLENIGDDTYVDDWSPKILSMFKAKVLNKGNRDNNWDNREVPSVSGGITGLTPFSSKYYIETIDGMLFYFDTLNNYPTITVDTNGLKGPNKIGYDVFFFDFDENSNIVPVGLKYIRYQDNTSLSEATWKDTGGWADLINCGEPNKKIEPNDDTIGGYGCAGRIVEEGFKITYF